MELEGKTAFVTGGSKGIGYGVAAALVDAGSNVVITARNENEVAGAAERLSQRGGGRALGVRCDVRDFDDQDRAVQRAVEAFGGVHALIANAGVGAFGSVDEIGFEDWHRVIDTNLTGVFYSVRAALPQLEREGGWIITIGSLAGTNFFAGGSAYNASKFGLAGFTQAMMLDLRHRGIKTSTIMPGSVSTHFGGGTPSDADAWKIQPEDVGEMVLYLLRTPARTLPSKIEVRPAQPPQR